MSKKEKIFYISLLIIFIAINLLLSRTKILSETKSQSNKIVVRINNSLLFESNPIDISFEKGGVFNFLTSKEYSTTILNDKVPITSENVDIQWLDENNALIILNGVDQPPETIEVNFKDNISYSTNK